MVKSTLPVDVGFGYGRTWPGGLGVFSSGMLYDILMREYVLVASEEVKSSNGTAKRCPAL